MLLHFPSWIMFGEAEAMMIQSKEALKFTESLDPL